MTDLFHNKIDDEFEKMIYPLNLFQSFILQSKFSVNYGRVTPNGYLAHLKSFLGVILMLYIYISSAYYRILRTDNRFWVTFEPLFEVVFYGILASVIFAVNVAQSRNNVRLIIKMQEIHRLIGRDDGLITFKKHNWIILALLSMIYISIVIGIELIDLSYVRLMNILVLAYYDGNVIYAIQTIRFLGYEMKLWLDELKRFFATCCEPSHEELMKYFEEIDQQGRRLYTAFADIMGAFKLVSCVFQYSVSTFCYYILGHYLLYSSLLFFRILYAIIY